jgi:hypothetical protein
MEALRHLADRILSAPSAFNRERLLAAGIDSPERFTNLASVPLTRRPELVADQVAHLPYGTRRFADAPPPVRAGITGSGDSLLVLVWSAADLARERAAGARLLRTLGVQAGARVANALPGALATPGSLLLGDVNEELGALDVPLGAPETEAAARAAWELIDRVQPAILVLAPSSAQLFLDAAPGTERPWWHGIIWLQLPGTPRTHPLPPPSAGFGGWQRGWLAVPEVTSFVGGSCAAGCCHLDSGVVAEIVDEAGTPLAENAQGILALTVTDLDTPLLRYASGLRAKRRATCPCGAPGPILEIA